MDDITYAIKTTEEGTQILRTEPDGKVWWVPEAPNNRHYEEYLEWVAEGGEPEVIEA